MFEFNSPSGLRRTDASRSVEKLIDAIFTFFSLLELSLCFKTELIGGSLVFHYTFLATH